MFESYPHIHSFWRHSSCFSFLLSFYVVCIPFFNNCATIVNENVSFCSLAIQEIIIADLTIFLNPHLRICSLTFFLEREGNIDMREKHWLVAFYMHPDLLVYGWCSTSWATPPGLIFSLNMDSQMGKLTMEPATSRLSFLGMKLP